MHIYSKKGGKKYHSVSLILEKTKPISEIIKFKKIQEKYIKENGPDSWDNNRDESRARGSAIHAMAEYLAVNNPHCDSSVYKAAYDNLPKEYSEYGKELILHHRANFPYREVIEVEAAFIHEELEYGGRSDLLYLNKKENSLDLSDYKSYKGYIDSYRNKTCWQWSLMDKKRLKALSKRKTPDKNYSDWKYVGAKVKQPFLQLAMYKEGLEASGRLYKGNPLKIDRLVICVVTPYGVQEIPMPTSMMVDCHAEMLERIKKFKKMDIPINQSQAEYINVD